MYSLRIRLCAEQNSSRLAEVRFADFDELYQCDKEFPNELPGRFVGQSAVRIEALRGIADHHFRLIDDSHVQCDKDLPQMVLRPRRSQTAERSPHHRRWLAQPDTFSIGS